jgi:putative ABC transport system permease protein
MASGRYFEPTAPNDKESIILNQTAARQLGIPLPLPDSVFVTSTYDSKPGARRRVIGIMKDFNFKSLKEPIQPLAIALSREPNWEMAIRILPENREETIQKILTIWRRYVPNAPFEHTFVEDNFKATYQREARVGSVFLIFTILAVFIACLGVFGLAIYMAEQRTKEIGIRKVLGASSWDVVQLLTIDFAKLILIAFLLAAPLSWWMLDWWLGQFAYHINIPLYALFLSAILALFFALASASHRAFKAAWSNPVDSLRTE